MTLEEFIAQFQYREDGYGKTGVEREMWLSRGGSIVAESPQIIQYVEAQGIEGITYEISRCALEQVGPPVQSDQVLEALEDQQTILREIESVFNLKLLFLPVVPEDTPSDLYPNERYKNLCDLRGKVAMTAARRIAAVHIHKGMGNPDRALKVYNYAIEKFDRLMELGDLCGGERLNLYKIMAPDWQPEKYNSWEHFLERAQALGFAKELKDCHALIRLSRHGTIEFRVFDTTADLNQIVRWSKSLDELVREALS